MGKKKKKTAKKNPSGSSARKAQTPKKKAGLPTFAMLAGGILALFGGYFLYQQQAPSAAAPELTRAERASLTLRENRPTLSPDMFGGKVKRAYSIARQIPQVLDQIYCYCRCRENFGHKNLLSCYVDSHAST